MVLKKVGRPRVSPKRGRPVRRELNYLGLLRENAKLPFSEVVKKLEISKSMLYALETKATYIKKPSIDLAYKMCELYGCTLEDIFPT